MTIPSKIEISNGVINVNKHGFIKKRYGAFNNRLVRVRKYRVIGYRNRDNSYISEYCYGDIEANVYIKKCVKYINRSSE